MSSITTAIYGGGPFYSGGTSVINDIKGSGFTTVVAWALHVNPSGDLIFNDPTIVSDGAYIGDAGWPELLASLKQGETSVNRLLFSIGGWEVGDFPNIQSLIQSQGTGSDSILYKNFQALKNAIPTIDGIDLDDETLYDQNTTVAFSQMLNTLGYEVTFCPYGNTGFWVDCLYALNSQTPDLVTGFNLQCYAGGGNNTPQPWIDAIAQKMGSDFPAASFVSPGLWCRHGASCAEDNCPSDITSQFAGWKSSGIQGGFIWLYDDIQKCEGSQACGSGVSMNAAAYANAIAQGLQTEAVAVSAK
jgi:hypothetical protein